MAKDNKYGNVQIEGIPDDEPVFVLRAQDKFALPTLFRYKNLVRGIEDEDQQRTQEWFDNLDDVLDNFSLFASEFPDKIKLPD